ncbi:MAG: succinylglutamate desuccinylase, partial [Pseudomonadota bacterium]
MIKFIHNPEATVVGDNVEQFLRWLAGPSCIVLGGQDNSRCRAVVTLLHGNEPSGSMALFKWLKEKHQAHTKTIFIIVSVETALTPPLFHYRTLPDQLDINRCFRPPFDSKQGQLAKAILEVLDHYSPEALIDIHNTSGSGPAFGVATHQDKVH